LTYAAVRLITETVAKPGATTKNRINKESWKIRIQRQTSNWRKELSKLTESSTGSDNIKLIYVK
jgi:hypothetical protein